MTRLNLSLTNSVRSALSLWLVIVLFCGCSSSTTPSFFKENIVESVESICKNEYNLDVKAFLAGQTLWVYLPLEDIFIKSDTPEVYTESFTISQNQGAITEGTLKLDYGITSMPEASEKTQDYKFDEKAMEHVNNVWKVVRRIIFSTSQNHIDMPKFFCLVNADIKNGFEMREVFYIEDIKKVSYDFISWTEFQHRSIQETLVDLAIMDDNEGLHLEVKDISLEDFVVAQIQQRIKLKFQKPEVGKDVDVDKEILKIVASTLKTYGLDNVHTIQLNNIASERKITLNQAALLSKPLD